jgi:TPR repeat protein
MGRDADSVVLYLFSPTAPYKNWKLLRVRVGVAECTFDLSGLSKAVEGVRTELYRRRVVERAKEHAEEGANEERKQGARLQSLERKLPSLEAEIERLTSEKALQQYQHNQNVLQKARDLAQKQRELDATVFELRVEPRSSSNAVGWEERMRAYCDARQNERWANAAAAAEATKARAEEATVSFLKLRAASGSVVAQYDLALRYVDGRGVEKDTKEARRLLTLAAAAGDDRASGKLKELEELEAVPAPTHGQTNVPAAEARPEPGGDGAKGGS